MPTYDVELTSGGPPWTRYSKNYDKMSGTSMACPHVSGTGALVFAAGATDANGDGNVADDVRSILASTAEDLGHPETCQGNGLVDAEAVDSTSVGEPPTVSWVNPTDGEQVSGSVSIQIDAFDAEDSEGSLTVEWQIDGGSWQTASYDAGTGYYEATWDSTGVSDGDHTLNAEATDSDGNTTTDSITVTTENTDNAPTVSWVHPADGETVSGMVDIQLDASDDRDCGSDGDGVAESTDDPVSDATVEFTFTYDSDGDGDFDADDTSKSYTGTTDSSGAVSFKWKHASSGDYKAEVTGVTHTTYS